MLRSMSYVKDNKTQEEKVTTLEKLAEMTKCKQYKCKSLGNIMA